METFESMIEAKVMEKVEELKKTENKTEVGLKREDVLEEIEIEKRRLNLVIMGVKEEGKDEDFVKELLAVVAGRDVWEVTNVSRIRRQQEGKTRPIRLAMANQDSRIEILQARPGLRKHEEYQKVFVTPDLTRKQQRNDKLLRDKLNDFREGGEKTMFG